MEDDEEEEEEEEEAKPMRVHSSYAHQKRSEEGKGGRKGEASSAPN